jgi:cell division protein FtsB
MVPDFTQKRNREFFSKDFWYRAASISFIIILIILVVADFRIYQKKKQLSGQVDIYQKQIDSLKKSNDTLKEEIANIDNKDYLEKLAYEQFNQARPGEIEYIFIKDKNPIETKFNKEDNITWLAKISSAWESVISWIKNNF